MDVISTGCVPYDMLKKALRLQEEITVIVKLTVHLGWHSYDTRIRIGLLKLQVLRPHL
jgi:hypothetical protein